MKIDTSKLVQGEALLEALFDEESRPRIRWLRSMQKKRIIPYFKIGHLVYFDVEKVREALARRNLIRSV
jgi:hypothetical protein